MTFGKLSILKVVVFISVSSKLLIIVYSNYVENDIYSLVTFVSNKIIYFIWFHFFFS